jgi:hypothetical protein
MSSVLESTLATRFQPGTNLKHLSARGNWWYLLPSLERAGVLCIGVPQQDALALLARRAPHVEVICVTRGDRKRRERVGGVPELERIQWHDGRAPVPPGVEDRVDLVFLVGRRGRAWPAKHRAGAGLVQGILDRGGSVYLEHLGFAETSDNGDGGWDTRRFGASRFRLLPLYGEPALAVPKDDPQTLDRLVRKGVSHPWALRRLPGRARSLVRRLLGRRVPLGRYGVLLGGRPSRLGGHPPDYLCAVAAQDGIALDDHRWGLSLPVGYGSRKLIFYLYGPPPSGSGYVAKMVSDPSLNGRLENEARALRHLKGLAMSGVPEVVFSGLHAGLALVGETLIEGTPFRRLSHGGPACPHANAALDGLLELGRLTKRPVAATAVTSALGRLVGRFGEVYGDGKLVAFLDRQVEGLERHVRSVPLVFQHGDPGSWNLVVPPAGPVAFLDWESAEPAGLPLWDLFYFLRSYGVLTAQRRRVHAALRAFELSFLEDSDLSRWVRVAIARYCEGIGVAQPLIEPLFYTCWMHRSVKEATRIEPRHLDQGHYVNVLRLAVRERGRDALGRLFSLSE